MTSLGKRVKGILATINQLNIDEKEKTILNEKILSNSNDEDKFNIALKEVQEYLEKLNETTDFLARKKAEEITAGTREPEHLGRHTKESIEQELFSLKNIKPAFRNRKWEKRFDFIVQRIDQIKDEGDKLSLRAQAQAVRGGEI